MALQGMNLCISRDVGGTRQRTSNKLLPFTNLIGGYTLDSVGGSRARDLVDDGNHDMLSGGKGRK